MSVQLADALAEMLRTEGYCASVDGDDVSFKVEGQPFELQSFDADDGYARLVLGFALPADAPIQRALPAANARNAAAKAVKTTLYPERGFVLFTVEQLFDDPMRLQPVLQRCIGAARGTADEFFGELRKPERRKPRKRAARSKEEPAS